MSRAGGSGLEYGSSSVAAEFLRRVWRFDDVLPFERFRVRQARERYPEWRIKPGDDLDAIAAEICERPGDAYYLPHALHYTGRTDAHITQGNALVIDLDTDRLEAAVDALRRHDLAPHYTIATQPGRYQLVFLIVPVRVGRASRPGFLRRFARLQHAAYALVGGDRRASRPGQLYRIPGTVRRIGSRLVEVRVIGRSDHDAYAISAMERALGVSPSALQGCAPTNRRKRNGSVLRSPALVWLQTHKVGTGYRNRAAVALAYAAHFDGLDQAEALELVFAMLRNAEQLPRYPEADARATVAACYRQPKGLASAVLQTIADIEGVTMGRAVAVSVNRYMPGLRQRYVRKPVESLVRLPWCESTARVLETLVRLQRENRFRPVVIGGVELCQAAGVSVDTYHHRVLPTLKGLGIYHRTRYGLRLGSYDLRRIRRQDLTTYAIASRSPLRYPLEAVLRFWQSARVTAWRRFTAAIDRLRALVTPYFLSVAVHCILLPDERRAPRQPRGPPVSPTAETTPPLPSGSETCGHLRAAFEGGGSP